VQSEAGHLEGAVGAAEDLHQAIAVFGPIELPGDPSVVLCAVADEGVIVTIIVFCDLPPLGAKATQPIIVQVLSANVKLQHGCRTHITPKGVRVNPIDTRSEVGYP
jgi:hypothetical protein